ncbi:MAG: AAA family ATPase [Candidatus Latescibacteria bacterium]|nr:AAA family ATPase [Candidatus Latescibacterota bacterium]
MNIEREYTEEQEAMLNRVETILASGLTLSRLAAEAGEPEELVKKVLEREHFARGYGFSRRGEVLQKLAEWLEIQEPMERQQYANTATFQKIQAIIAGAHRARDFVAITGDVGIGKSWAATEYVRQHSRGYNKPGAVRVEFTRADRNDSSALFTILSALAGDVEASRSAYRNGHLQSAIGKVLNRDDCLILDECNYLGTAVDIVRDLWEKTRTAIVMIGNPELSRTIWVDKKQDFAALASRATRFDIPRTVDQDVEAFLDWKGIADKRLRKAAVEIAARPGQSGGLRTLTKILSLLDNYYPGITLDADTFKELAAQIGRA